MSRQQPPEPTVIVAQAAPVPPDPLPVQAVKGNLFEYNDEEEGEGEDAEGLFNKEENLSTAD